MAEILGLGVSHYPPLSGLRIPTPGPSWRKGNGQTLSQPPPPTAPPCEQASAASGRHSTTSTPTLCSSGATTNTKASKKISCRLSPYWPTKTLRSSHASRLVRQRRGHRWTRHQASALPGVVPRRHVAPRTRRALQRAGRAGAGFYGGASPWPLDLDRASCRARVGSLDRAGSRVNKNSFWSPRNPRWIIRPFGSRPANLWAPQTFKGDSK